MFKKSARITIAILSIAFVLSIFPDRSIAFTRVIAPNPASLPNFTIQHALVDLTNLITKIFNYKSNYVAKHPHSPKTISLSITNSNKKVLAASTSSNSSTNNSPLTLASNNSISFLQSAISNLLRNSSFEVQTSGQPRSWNYQLDSTTSNTFISAEGIHSGSFGLKFVGGGTGNFGISQPDVKTVPQRTYTLSTYIKVINAPSITLTLGFWDEYNNKMGATKTFSFSATKDWSRVNATFTTPGLITDPKNEFPIIEVTGLTSGAVYLDDMLLQEGSVLTNYNSAQAYTSNAGGDGSVLFSTGGDILPAINGSGSLGSSTNKFQALYLSNLTIDSNGSISSTGSGTFNTLAVGSSGQFAVNTSGQLSITYSGDTGSSAGQGIISIDNTNNLGNALAFTTNAGGSAAGNLINLAVNNRAFTKAAFHEDYYGIGNGFEITSNSNDASSNALAVTGNNINDSTLGIIGYEQGKGTIKITHNKPSGVSDNNASGVSIDLKGSGTAAQGLYVDSTETGGTTGNLLRLRNQSVDKFVVNYQGNVSQGGYGYDTTYTKFGNTTNDQFFIGTNGSFRVQRAVSNSEAFRVQISGDTQGRWRGTSDGSLQWGDGTNSQDVILQRSAAGLLTLQGGITFNNTNASYDSDFKGTTDNNLLYINSSLNQIGVGTSTPIAPVDIEKDGLGNSALIVNQKGANGDLFTASLSGVTKFLIDNTGNAYVNGGSLKTTASTFNIVNSTPTTINLGGAATTINIGATGGTTTFKTNVALTAANLTLDNSQGYQIKDSGGTARNLLFYTSGNNVQILNPASTGQVQIGINNASNTSAVLFTTNNNLERMRIDQNGNVGINTASPVFKLDTVDTQNSTSSASITNLSTSDTASTNVLSLNLGTATSGTSSRFIQFFAGANSQRNAIGVGRIQLNNGNVAYNTGGADFAEYFSKGSTPLTPGDIVTIDSQGDTTLATKNTGAIGIVSNTAGFIGNAPHDPSDEQNKVIVGLVGQLKVKVSSENGAIHPGDNLTVSSIPGVAMKSSGSGASVGKALQDYTSSDPKSIGQIMAYVNLSLTNQTQNISTQDLKPISLNFSAGADNSIPLDTSSFDNKVSLINSSISLLQDANASLSAEVSSLNKLTDRVSALEKLTSLANLSSANPVSSSSSDSTFNSLTVSGKTSLNDVGITGSLSIGLLKIDGLDDSTSSASATINTLSGPLKLQSMGLGGVDFLSGKVVIDPTGALHVYNTLTAKKINLDTTDASTSAVGEGKISSGESKVDIKTTAVTPNSRIFVTSETKSSGALYVTSKKDSDSFTVELDHPAQTDVMFNWWVIN